MDRLLYLLSDAAGALALWGADVTFEEYGIWWYHFFYTALTDQLGAVGVIQVPATGLFHYGVVR